MEPQPETLLRSTRDPKDRERLEIVARDYEKMAEAAERLLRT
jgi:hypothetical protein